MGTLKTDLLQIDGVHGLQLRSGLSSCRRCAQRDPPLPDPRTRARTPGENTCRRTPRSRSAFGLRRTTKRKHLPRFDGLKVESIPRSLSKSRDRCGAAFRDRPTRTTETIFAGDGKIWTTVSFLQKTSAGRRPGHTPGRPRRPNADGRSVGSAPVNFRTAIAQSGQRVLPQQTERKAYVRPPCGLRRLRQQERESG